MVNGVHKMEELVPSLACKIPPDWFSIQVDDLFGGVFDIGVGIEENAMQGMVAYFTESEHELTRKQFHMLYNNTQPALQLPQLTQHLPHSPVLLQHMVREIF